VITQEQYFAAKPHDGVDEGNADDLLTRVNALIDQFVLEGGGSRMKCPNTGTEISGSKSGHGDGGFRLATATTGKANSSHKQAKGVDVYDPYDTFDAWLTDEKLEQHGLYREHPSTTPTWTHLTTRAPESGHRTFWP
jgi:hypothetical protein